MREASLLLGALPPAAATRMPLLLLPPPLPPALRPTPPASAPLPLRFQIACWACGLNGWQLVHEVLHEEGNECLTQTAAAAAVPCSSAEQRTERSMMQQPPFFETHLQRRVQRQVRLAARDARRGGIVLYIMIW